MFRKIIRINSIIRSWKKIKTIFEINRRNILKNITNSYISECHYHKFKGKTKKIIKLQYKRKFTCRKQLATGLP